MLLLGTWGRCSLGHCIPILLLAVLFDVVGLILLLLGILASLNYWDFLVYTGSLFLAFSLVFWISWYSLSLKVCPEKLNL
uniref:Transmembrane protein 238 like n=1 Tax=Monodelphis domestica TaxID=13616 RepID=A0A5F8GLP2_MONDO